MATHSSLNKVPEVEKYHGQVDCDFCYCIDFNDPKSDMSLIKEGHNKIIFYSTFNLKDRLIDAKIKTSDYLDLVISIIGQFDPVDLKTFNDTMGRYVKSYRENNNKNGCIIQLYTHAKAFLINNKIIDHWPEKSRY